MSRRGEIVAESADVVASSGAEGGASVVVDAGGADWARVHDADVAAAVVGGAGVDAAGVAVANVASVEAGAVAGAFVRTVAGAVVRTMDDGEERRPGGRRAAAIGEGPPSAVDEARGSASTGVVIVGAVATIGEGERGGLGGLMFLRQPSAAK